MQENTTHEAEYEYRFKQYQQKVCSNYVPSHLDTALCKLLNEKHLVFLYGGPGVGKTQLARKYVLAHKHPTKNNKHNNLFNYCENCSPCFNNKRYCDIAEIDSDTLLSDDPNFIGSTLFGDKIESLESALKTKNSSSLLIIDAPFLDKKLLDFIENTLNSLYIHIIITTYSTPPDDFINSSLKVSYEFSELNKIYKSYFPKIQCENKSKNHIDLNEIELKQLFEYLDNNTLMISLTARTLVAHMKQLDNKKYKPDDVISKEKLFNTDEWLWYSYKLPQIKNAYTNGVVTHADASSKGIKYPISLQKHSLAMLNNLQNSDFSSIYPTICVLASSEISLNYLNKYACIELEHLHAAIDIGLLLYTDSKKQFVKMNNLFFHIFWYFYYSPQTETKYNTHQHKLDFDFCETTISNLITVYNSNSMSELNFATIHNILMCTLPKAHRLFTSYSVYVAEKKDNDEPTNNATKKEIQIPKKEIAEKWNIFLLYILNFYMDRGNIDLAQKLIDKIFVTTNKHDKPNEQDPTHKLLVSIMNTRLKIIQDDSICKNSFPTDIDNIAKIASESISAKYIPMIIQSLQNDFLNQILRFAQAHSDTNPEYRYIMTNTIDRFSSLLNTYIAPDSEDFYYYKFAKTYLYFAVNRNARLAAKIERLYMEVVSYCQNSDFKLKSDLLFLNYMIQYTTHINNMLFTLTINAPFSYNDNDNNYYYIKHTSINSIVDFNKQIRNNFSTAMTYDTQFMYYVSQINFFGFIMQHNLVTLAEVNFTKNIICKFKILVETQLSLPDDIKEKFLDLLHKTENTLQ